MSKHFRLRWIGRIALIIACLAVAAAAIRIVPLFLAPNAYSGVTSIEHSATYRDPALMRAAWASPVAASYRRVPFEFQHNQSFCGPTSVADVLHSIGDPGTQTSVMHGSAKHTWFGYLVGGMTLDEVGRLLARETGGPVQIVRNLNLTQFRQEMRLANNPRYRIIANFHRGPLFGRGHGHFSPILAYLKDRDLILVGDVNAAYRPYLVSTDRLWRAIDTVDPDTKKKRGLAVLQTN